MVLTLSAGKRDLVLEPVWTNAPGMLGFSDEAAKVIDLMKLGALVTNPVSLAPRSPARGCRLIPYQGGILLHTGLPNPGLQAVLRDHRRRWRDLPCPVILHLVADSPEEAGRMAERVEAIDEVAGLEVGLGPAEPEAIAQIVAACAAAQKPVLAELSVSSASESIQAARSAGATAIVLGPPRGSLPGPGGAVVQGRLYGPAVFPLALRAVAAHVRGDACPVIAGAGAYSSADASALLAAGAAAVQFDTVLWTEPDVVLGDFPSRPRVGLPASGQPA